MSTGTAAVVVRDLRVERSGRPVLPGVSLEVPRGEVTGLLGPSGCGKTTLLRTIVGVQRVAGGTVTVLGATAGSPPLRRQVAYMTQAPSVYSDLTVSENLQYFAALVDGRGALRPSSPPSTAGAARLARARSVGR